MCHGILTPDVIREKIQDEIWKRMHTFNSTRATMWLVRHSSWWGSATRIASVNFSPWGNSSPKCSVSKDIAVQNMQLAGMFQHKTCNQEGNVSAKYAVGRDVPVQNMHLARIFHYRVSSQQGYSSTKYPVTRVIPLQSIQSLGTFQYKICSQQGFSSTKYPVQKYPVSRDVPIP